MRDYHDRRDAGRVLGAMLMRYAGRDDVVVLALPRGGVPVGCQVALALHAPLDVYVVRKLGLPGHEELAMGAIASGGVRVLNEDLVARVDVPDRILESVTQQETRELLRREHEYRAGRPLPSVAGKTVIVVDDGLATGATMRAAVRGLRQLGPSRIVVAVPVAAPSTCEEIASEVDELVCPSRPEPFFSVGSWYEDFAQTTDDEVRSLLESARSSLARRRVGREDRNDDGRDGGDGRGGRDDRDDRGDRDGRDATR